MHRKIRKRGPWKTDAGGWEFRRDKRDERVEGAEEIFLVDGASDGARKGLLPNQLISVARTFCDPLDIRSLGLKHCRVMPALLLLYVEKEQEGARITRRVVDDSTSRSCEDSRQVYASAKYETIIIYSPRALL